MKKIAVYIIVLIVGIGIGYFLLNASGTSDTTSTTTEESSSWTCSMHPQINQPEPGDCPICGMDLILADQAEANSSPLQIKMTKNAIALANVETTLIDNSNESANQIKLSGIIKESENNKALQAAYFKGRIEFLYTKETGKKIKRGQLIAKIYSPELVSAQQELLTAAANKSSQPALYNAVRNKLSTWKLTEKQINNIEKSGEVLRDFPIYANTTGTITLINVEEGDYVQEGQILFEVSNLNEVWAVFDAYENQIGALQEGQEITIEASALRQNPIETKIDFISPILNTTTRTVGIRAIINNKEDKFKPGMFITGAVHIDNKNKSTQLSIPETAVLWTGEQSVVYVKPKKDESVFELRKIRLGQKTGNTYTVLSGLKPGEEIVTNGTFTVDAAAQLQGKKSMMSLENKPKTHLPEKAQEQLKEAIAAYLQMKDAFVQDNTSEISAQASKMLAHLAIDIQEPKEAKETIINVKSALEKIAKETNLEKQRVYLVGLSDNFIKFIEKNMQVDTPLYVQQCPMANNDQGAVWLSTEKEVRNPYYGDKMLKCGSVINSL